MRFGDKKARSNKNKDISRMKLPGIVGVVSTLTILKVFPHDITPISS